MGKSERYCEFSRRCYFRVARVDIESPGLDLSQRSAAMSLLDSLGSLLGGSNQGEGGNSLISIAGQLIQQAGGVQGLASTLQQHGLGGAVQSWVGTGANQAISGDQLN